MWTCGFHRLIHAASDTCAVEARPEGWHPSRGAGEYMYIQARASKEYKGVAASLVSRGPSNEMVFEDVKRQKVGARARQYRHGHEKVLG